MRARTIALSVLGVDLTVSAFSAGIGTAYALVALFGFCLPLLILSNGRSLGARISQAAAWIKGLTLDALPPGREEPARP